jgi:peptidoglycan/LPS O-acetylase OafA/YrhL
MTAPKPVPPSVPPRAEAEDAASGAHASGFNKARIIGLDGARGVACLAVAVMHIAVHYSPETSFHAKINLLGLALIFFYVLSGFLLFLPYIRALVAERDSTQMPSTRNFAIHRIARVFPAYLVIFLFCNYIFRSVYLENAAVQPVGGDAGTGMITDPLQLFANLTLIQSYFPQFIQTGINPSWSLTLELAFYASLPVLGWLMFTLLRKTSMSAYRIAMIAPLLLIAMGYIARLFIGPLAAHLGLSDPVMMNWGPNWVAVLLRSYLTSADNFAFGMIVAVLVVAMERRVVREAISKRVRMYAWLALLPTSMLSLLLLALFSVYASSAVALAAAVMILIIIAPLARNENSAIANALEFRPIRYIGTISLSIYLWHYPMMIVLGRFGWLGGDTWPGLLRNVAIVMAATLLFSAVTYRYIEKPPMEFARRFRYRSK